MRRCVMLLRDEAQGRCGFGLGSGQASAADSRTAHATLRWPCRLPCSCTPACIDTSPCVRMVVPTSKHHVHSGVQGEHTSTHTHTHTSQPTKSRESPRCVCLHAGQTPAVPHDPTVLSTRSTPTHDSYQHNACDPRFVSTQRKVHDNSRAALGEHHKHRPFSTSMPPRVLALALALTLTLGACGALDHVVLPANTFGDLSHVQFFAFNRYNYYFSPRPFSFFICSFDPCAHH